MSSTVLPPSPPPVTAPSVLGAVRETLGDLVGTLWAARPPEELVAVVRECERVRSVLDAVQLQVIAEVDAVQAARREEWACTKDFVTAVTGGYRGAGRRLVALAKAVTTDRTATGAALVAGAISRTQAEVVVAAIDRLPVSPGLRAAAEEVLLGEATVNDATDLTHRATRIINRLDPDGDERRDERALQRQERAAHAGRFLSITGDGIGGVRVKGRGTLEDAAIVKNALAALAAPQPPAEPGGCGGTPGSGRSCGIADCAHDGRDPREHGTRLWDALVGACQRLADAEVLPASHGTKPRLAVVVPFDSLRWTAPWSGDRSGSPTAPDPRDVARAAARDADRHPESGLLDGGLPLSVATLRRLACDADVLPCVLGSRSEILDLGRTQRLVTSALWVALVLRDRHCAFPGCTRPPIACDAHHLHHWADGGSTSLDNLVLLCRAHHTVLHTTPWGVRLHPHDRRPEFLPPPRLDPEGQPLRHRPLRE